MNIHIPFIYDDQIYYRLCCNENQIRIPVQISIVLDKSISMSTPILNKTIFEYTKDAIKILVQMLSENDHFSLIIYDDNPECVFPYSLMTQDNKTEFLKILYKLEVGGCTNIYDALKLAISNIDDIYNSTAEEYKYQINSNILLFTDGQENVNTKSMEDYKNLIENSYCDNIIHTFAYGKDLSPKLMINIAKYGQGIYCHLLNEVDLENVFKNITASILTTCVKNIVIKHQDGEIKIGSMSFGQSRDIVLNAMYNNITIDYKDLISNYKTSIIYKPIEYSNPNHYIIFKIEFLNLLDDFIDSKNIEYKQKIFNEFWAKYNMYNSFIKNDDLNKIMQSISTDDMWDKIGQHFIPSVFCFYQQEIFNSQTFNSVLNDIENMLEKFKL